MDDNSDLIGAQFVDGNGRVFEVTETDPEFSSAVFYRSIDGTSVGCILACLVRPNLCHH